jgi:glycosyltransferase involved in cell wall biosynthesis
VRRSDRSFAPSELMVRCFSGSRGSRPDLLRSPVAVHSEDLDDSFYETHLKGMKYLLYFGTLNRMKGVEVLSRAIGSLVEEFPDLHVVFIGRTGSLRDKQYYARKILRGNGPWSDHMHHFQALPKDLLYPAVRGAYGVVIPSLIDNYPNTCLEAMQFGRIVVGTKGSSIDEMIVDGETGILAEKGNVESLRTGIHRLLNLSIAEKREMELRIEQAFATIVAEDRIGQLIQFYRTTIDMFNSRQEQRPLGSMQVRPLERSRRELWMRILGEGVSNAGASFDRLRSFLRRG